jgi:MOSC domain-containing protein YiiM
MEPQDSLELTAGKGIVGDHTFGRMRHVTIVFEDDWNAAAAVLGRSVDPAGRRANVLVSGGQGPRLVGQTLRLGSTLIEIKGITQPCPVMEQAAVGMAEALRPEGRAGVWGRVLESGRVALSDALGSNDQPAGT